MYTVLLSGGSGKRLWPLSNDLRSKQYLKIVKGIKTNNITKLDDTEIITDLNNLGTRCHSSNPSTPLSCQTPVPLSSVPLSSCQTPVPLSPLSSMVSMIERVWSQLDEANMLDGAIITAGKSQVEIIKSQLGLDVKIAIEPQRRDTFPAIALSCAYLSSVLNADESDCVAVLPVDPYTEQLYFETVKMLETVVKTSNCDIALMGAMPTYPSEKYGYVVPFEYAFPTKIYNKNESFDVCKVKGFVEKPSKETAEDLLAKGALWNCGVFCFKIGFILNYLKEHNIPTDYQTLYDNYEMLEKISFDYKILEKCNNISVVKFTGQWKDLGTWNTLCEEMNAPTIGNCIVSESSVNTHVVNELEIPLVVIGGQNLIIAASSDGILVSDKSQSSHMKEFISDIGGFPMYEERRWGNLKVIDISRKDNVLNMTRRIKINSKMNSSLHYHENRDEIWTILSGNGLLIRDGDLINVKAGDSVRIPKQSKHAIFADSCLDIIEIQIGESIGSEDITRILYEWPMIWKMYFPS